MKKNFVISAIIVTLLLVHIISCTPPAPVTAPPGEPPSPVQPTPPAKLYIKDLASISILTSTLNWDADPEPDGIGVDIVYRSATGQPVNFSGVPVRVAIEFFGYGDILDTFKHDRMELISRTEVTVDHSMRLSEMFGNYIRVPFETIPVDRTKYYRFGTIKVVVTTPQQGSFGAIEDWVELYPES